MTVREQRGWLPSLRSGGASPRRVGAVSPSRWLAVRFGHRRDELARWWGCWWPNRVLDGAGPYRRVAAALLTLPLPLIGLATSSTLRTSTSAGYRSLHLVAAVGCLWFSVDVIRTGAVSRDGRPHPGAIALGLAVISLIAARPVALDLGLGVGPLALLGPALAVLIGALTLATVGEHRRVPLLIVLARITMVGGVLVLGSVGLGEAGRAFSIAPDAAIGRGVVAAILLALAVTEARVLLRGRALLRAAAQR